MKKIISVFLSALMLLSLFAPAVSALEIGSDVAVHESRSQIPVIRILGDGEPLYNKDGKKIFHLRTALFEGDSATTDSDNSEIYKSIANVLMPFLVQGLLMDDWDPYYENLEKEISELVDDSRLDTNGDPVNGTGISQQRRDYMENAVKIDQKAQKGYYGIDDYRFWYDWRLDPLYTADLLNEYIQQVKAITQCDKVAIMASCIGSIITTTYIGKYGTKDLNGVGYTGSIAGGAEILSETISGKFDLNGAAINRILLDSTDAGLFELDSFIMTTIDLLIAAGVIDGAEQAIRDTIYDKLVAGVTSALALSTFYTWPSYWAAVTEDDYDDAMLFVFGEEGSEKRQEYAGLIKKIETYNTEIRKNYNDIIASIGENGVNFGAIAKYGFQILPICESNDAVADQFVSVKRASFGATTGTLYEDLSDSYIDIRIAEGKGKYISPDKQIDASTCAYPDSTWFVKGSSHSDYTAVERKLLYDVITADYQITVDDYDFGQFMVYDYDTDIMENMTEENCDIEKWVADKKIDQPDNILGKLFVFLRALIYWFIALFERF